MGEVTVLFSPLSDEELFTIVAEADVTLNRGVTRYNVSKLLRNFVRRRDKMGVAYNQYVEAKRSDIIGLNSITAEFGEYKQELTQGMEPYANIARTINPNRRPGTFDGAEYWAASIVDPAFKELCEQHKALVSDKKRPEAASLAKKIEMEYQWQMLDRTKAVAIQNVTNLYYDEIESLTFSRTHAAKSTIISHAPMIEGRIAQVIPLLAYIQFLGHTHIELVSSLVHASRSDANDNTMRSLRTSELIASLREYTKDPRFTNGDPAPQFGHNPAAYQRLADAQYGAEPKKENPATDYSPTVLSHTDVKAVTPARMKLYVDSFNARAKACLPKFAA